jgi:hypothetical protein
LTVKSLISSPISRKENFKIKTQKRVLDNQRKLKGTADWRRTPKASPLRIVATPEEDLKMKKKVEVEVEDKVSE